MRYPVSHLGKTYCPPGEMLMTDSQGIGHCVPEISWKEVYPNVGVEPGSTKYPIRQEIGISGYYSKVLPFPLYTPPECRK